MSAENVHEMGIGKETEDGNRHVADAALALRWDRRGTNVNLFHVCASEIGNERKYPRVQITVRAAPAPTTAGNASLTKCIYTVNNAFELSLCAYVVDTSMGYRGRGPERSTARCGVLVRSVFSSATRVTGRLFLASPAKVTNRAQLCNEVERGWATLANGRFRRVFVKERHPESLSL
ncbi:hypothetical protein EVAR_70383_1 [Eumeta japonica]|uniref:Uncharacterized protein n=1 Tax=Eumeta variegata TaxID=151549 RepID=A0A4C2A8E5_EUMVA|nr:hypothetical protein EVAR_70383_1 [Eumeta japonica]